MSALVKAAVIDASVALKWVFNDEEAIEAATVMLQHIARGDLQAHVPDLFAYEVSNALWAAVRQGRLTLEESMEALQALRLLRLTWHPLSAIWDDAFTLAAQYDRSFYDSVYVALAQHLQVPLFTGDRRLYHALHGRLRCRRLLLDELCGQPLAKPAHMGENPLWRGVHRVWGSHNLVDTAPSERYATVTQRARSARADENSVHTTHW